VDSLWAVEWGLRNESGTQAILFSLRYRYFLTKIVRQVGLDCRLGRAVQAVRFGWQVLVSAVELSTGTKHFRQIN